MARSIILVELVVFLSFIVGFNLRRKLKNRDPFGEFPIHPWLFKIGKVSMGISWFILLVQAAGFNLNLFQVPAALNCVAALLVLFGLAFSIPPFFHLGDGSRFGLPRESIEIRTAGIYGISRNPMYLGFYLITIASLISVPNPINVCSGLVGIRLHHRIVLAEERFLLSEYGTSYKAYMERVRRYL
jgi:protein-S-isoprenylcysteine O-methyltransferase Ste14